MKKYYFLSALSALFITVSGANSAAENSLAAEDFGAKKPTVATNHRQILSGVSMRGKEMITAGAKKFIFDDIVKFNQDPYKSIYFQCGSFEGNGIMNAENIKIVADEFSFSGTLKYTQSCTIVTPVAVDQKQFSAQGPHAPIFIVDPTLPKFTVGSAFAHFKEQGEMVLSAKIPEAYQK